MTTTQSPPSYRWELKLLTASRAKGEKIVFPKVELISNGSSIPLNESLYWAPNRVLAQAAKADGFELMDPTSIQEPDQDDQKINFASRLVYPYKLWLKGKSPSSQMLIPVNGQPKDVCDDKYIDPWRHAWNRFMFPGALTVSKSHTDINSTTNSSEADVEAFYKNHFPRSQVEGSDLYNGRRNTVIKLNEFDMTVWITEQECQGCSKTSVKIVGDLAQVLREERMKTTHVQEEGGINP